MSKDDNTYTSTIHDEIDEIRRQWRQLGERIDSIERRNMPIPRKKTASRREKLMLLTLRMAIATCIMPIWGVPTLIMAGIPIWINAAFAIFCVSMGIAQYTIYKHLKQFEIGKLSAKEALKRVVAIAALRTKVRSFGLAYAIPLLVALTIFFYHASQAAFTGCLIGTVIGSAIGTAINRYSIKWLREMRRELETELGID